MWPTRLIRWPPEDILKFNDSSAVAQQTLVAGVANNGQD